MSDWYETAHKVLENWCVAIVVCVYYDGYGPACGRGLKKIGLLLLGLCFLMGMELHMMGFKKNRSTTTAVCVCHDGYK